MATFVKPINNDYRTAKAAAIPTMNFLAHAYLSFDNEQILVGNMISDFVKGKARYSYPPAIEKGILLHRQIDSFTDAHDAVREVKEIFRPSYRLYSSPIVDVLFDHFLANDESVFPAASLNNFTQTVYNTLEKYVTSLPFIFSQVFTFMKVENWLLNYGTTEGMEKSLRGLVRRSSFLKESTTAFHLFLDNYDTIKKSYAVFFPDVKSFAKQLFEELTVK